MSEYIIELSTYELPDGSGKVAVPKECKEEIVRCRDCECLDTWEFADGTVRNVCSNFEYTDVVLDGFCAWAERRDA